MTGHPIILGHQDDQSCAAPPNALVPPLPAPPLPPVQVDLPGGPLMIEWREADNHIYMTGPAELAFTGVAKL